MQFIKKTSSRQSIINILIKLFLILVIILGGVFLLNKIDFPAPTKEIQKRIRMRILKLLNNIYFAIIFFLLSAIAHTEDKPVDIWNLDKEKLEKIHRTYLIKKF